MTQNKAAWLVSKQAYPYTIDDAPMPIADPNQVTIRVHAVAINPADYVIQALGLVYTKFPTIPGCDAAGDVVGVGSNVQRFGLGDRVIVPLNDGAFQLFVLPIQP